MELLYEAKMTVFSLTYHSFENLNTTRGWDVDADQTAEKLPPVGCRCHVAKRKG
jgi:hypothetical protein